MKYEVSGNILDHTEVPPVLKVVDGKYFDFEGQEYILVPEKSEEPTADGGMGIAVVIGLLVVGVLAFVLKGKK